jgi:LPXTG-site transpeptidase (sortase) family protein
MVASEGQPKGRRSRGALGAILIASGALLLALAWAYYGYGLWARSNLDELNVTRARPTEIAPSTEARVIRVSAVMAEDHHGSAISTPAEALNETEPANVVAEPAPLSTAAEATGEDAAASASAEQPADDGAVADTAAVSIDPPSEPVPLDTQHALPAESTTIVGTDEAAGNEGPTAAVRPAPGPEPQAGPEEKIAQVANDPVDESPLAVVSVDPAPEPEPEDPRVALLAEAIEASRVEAAMYSAPTMVDLDRSMAPATRLRIPAINIDSGIKELAVIRSAEGAAWETPKHIVGHIPTTATAGGGGQGWYFGHLESPIRREGNVFRRLPEIAELLKIANGDPIYIFLESENGKFVYEVYHTTVVPQEELLITDSGAQDVTLVTCTPRFYYDQRLLVTAALVGVMKS